MNNFVKIISLILCLFILVFSSACGGKEDNKRTTVNQKAYNTLFRQPTSAVPNTTTIKATDDETNDATVTVAEETTVARTGQRPFFEQTSDMRNIKSSQMLQEINAGINIGDSFNAFGLGKGKTVDEYETYLGNPLVSERLIDAYYISGFRAVRLPVSWTEHMDDKGNIDEDWIERIEEIAGYILEKDMYCIINSQNDQNWLTTESKKFNYTKKKFSAMWKSIALRFKKYNDHLIFEAVGELLKADNDRSQPSKSDIDNSNTLNKIFVKTIRNTGGNNKKRHLIISTYGSFIDYASLNGFKVPVDTVKNKLIAKVNAYVPSEFCLDENGIKIWGSEDDKKYIETVLSAVNKRFSELNIPVIIGEFGAVNKGNESAREAFAKHFIKTAYNYYMVCFWWDNGSDFALFNRDTFSTKHKRLVNAIIK